MVKRQQRNNTKEPYRLDRNLPYSLVSAQDRGQVEDGAGQGQPIDKSVVLVCSVLKEKHERTEQLTRLQWVMVTVTGGYGSHKLRNLWQSIIFRNSYKDQKSTQCPARKVIDYVKQQKYVNLTVIAVHNSSRSIIIFNWLIEWRWAHVRKKCSNRQCLRALLKNPEWEMSCDIRATTCPHYHSKERDYNSCQTCGLHKIQNYSNNINLWFTVTKNSLLHNPHQLP